MKYLKFVVSAIVLFFLASCSEKENPGNTPLEPALPVTLPEASALYDYRPHDFASFDFRVAEDATDLTIAASCAADWVTDVSVDDSKVKFSLSENDGDEVRMADIVLSWGEPVTLQNSCRFCVVQNWAETVITLSTDFIDVSVEGGRETFSFNVVNSRVNTSIVCTSEVSWITASQNGSKIICDIKENTSQKERTGTVTVKHGDFASAKFTVRQAWTTSEINAEDIIHVSSAGELIRLDYSIKDTRTGATLVPSTDDSSWIFNISNHTTSGSTSGYITFNVSQNPSGSSSRVGEISLKYGKGSDNYAIKRIPVVQDVDLSVGGTANCYIIPSPGRYLFKGNVKGNSQNEVIDGIVSADVLWESFNTNRPVQAGDLITHVEYKDGYVIVDTPLEFKNGNAVVAVRDSRKEILWSWHLWVCENYAPADCCQVYNNNAGVMMDRNLGALNTKGGSAWALGLLYQWGRKDPFLGRSSLYVASNPPFMLSSITWPDYGLTHSPETSIAYAVKSPTEFLLCNTYNYDWYNNNMSSSTDNTRWSSTKTIYDPCPLGWRVPDGGPDGVWAKAFGKKESWETESNYQENNCGMNFGDTDLKLGQSSYIWYPAASCRSGVTGNFSSIFIDGYYWSCTPAKGYFAYILRFEHHGSVNPVSTKERADALSVRCVAE